VLSFALGEQIVRNEGHGRAVDWWSLGILLYEMLFARLPFAPVAQGKGGGGKSGRGGRAAKDPRMEPGTDEYKAEVKKRIQFSKVTYPRGPYVANVSNAAKNLIQRLLARSPEQRLQGEAVMQHEWFKAIDWAALRARKVRNQHLGACSSATSPVLAASALHSLARSVHVATIALRSAADRRAIQFVTCRQQGVNLHAWRRRCRARCRARSS
jgi:serine/threonine protein kinase